MNAFDKSPELEGTDVVDQLVGAMFPADPQGEHASLVRIAFNALVDPSSYFGGDTRDLSMVNPDEVICNTFGQQMFLECRADFLDLMQRSIG